MVRPADDGRRAGAMQVPDLGNLNKPKPTHAVVQLAAIPRVVERETGMMAVPETGMTPDLYLAGDTLLDEIRTIVRSELRAVIKELSDIVDPAHKTAHAIRARG